MFVLTSAKPINHLRVWFHGHVSPWIIIIHVFWTVPILKVSKERILDLHQSLLWHHRLTTDLQTHYWDCSYLWWVLQKIDWFKQPFEFYDQYFTSEQIKYQELMLIHSAEQSDPIQALNVPVIPLGTFLAAIHPFASSPPYVLSWLKFLISAPDMMHPELFEKLIFSNFG